MCLRQWFGLLEMSSHWFARRCVVLISFNVLQMFTKTVVHKRILANFQLLQNTVITKLVDFLYTSHLFQSNITKKKLTFWSEAHWTESNGQTTRLFWISCRTPARTYAKLKLSFTTPTTYRNPSDLFKVGNRFAKTSANFIYCITCTLCKKIIGKTLKQRADCRRQ